MGLRHRSLVSFAGAQNELAGLDQVNLLLPRELAGRGETDVMPTADGKAANPVKVRIKRRRHLAAVNH
ncbi:MAG TPA: hypothetical protein PKC13_01600 [Blastocatellia bacterium]|nr:hypothetical protein [Blastocatellia bacterium]HMX24290.1 hypothetical protein [Blastocatellia bacterium]HMY75389.1 hypothetical protein [Blastocatellia bacterium]HNG28643.1 hypothetical protein [Blastocatellia bacterium]